MHLYREQHFYSEWWEFLSHDNYNISHVTNTENIVKLAQMIHRYIISKFRLLVTSENRL